MTTRIFLLLFTAIVIPAMRAGKSDLVDINSAGTEQLKTLPGIQQAKAQAIVKNRPYLNKAELLSRKILSAAEYRRVRDLIIARQ
jgi:competence protein ComEA